jgi:hypothetical protein
MAENLVEEMVNQRSLTEVVGKCGIFTFYHDSIVGESLVAAVHDNMDTIHIGKRSQDAESNLYSVHGTSCGSPEIKQLTFYEETGSFPEIKLNPVESFVKKEAVDVLKLLMLVQSLSNEKLHHTVPEDQEICAKLFDDGKFGFLVGMFMLASCLNESLLKGDVEREQNVDIYLNRKGLVYSKGRLFEFCYIESDLFSSMSGKISHSLFVPSGSQSKSNNYAKKHPPVIVGQRSPSSSEDG